MKKIIVFRRVCGVLAALSFMLALGSVGSIEQNLIPLGQGCLQAAGGIGGFGLFAWLAGGFV